MAASRLWPRSGGLVQLELRVELAAIRIESPDDLNVIIGQAHFIKTLEDLHEALAGSSPHLRFGIAWPYHQRKAFQRMGLSVVLCEGHG